MKTPIEPHQVKNREQSAGLTILYERLVLPMSIILTIFLFTGCFSTTRSVRLPPVTDKPAGQIQDGHFIWIDLMTEDTVAAASFYSRLFGWRAAKSDEDDQYYLFYRKGRPIAGMAALEGKDETAPESLWLSTISVSDVDKSAASVKAYGGKVLEGPLDAAGRGRMALVSDSADAPFILLGANGEKRMGIKARAGQWFWTDLVTQDKDHARAFYTSLFGYEVKRVEAGEGHEYSILKRDGRAVAGIVELQWKGLEDNWLPYFKVADVDKSIEEARKLGGKLILKSNDVAVLTDPTGAAFGIQAR